MAKKFQLQIPKPCHENWDQMHPVEKGRYCNACAKEVVDFTNMSDRQLAEFFKRPSGATCGRFADDQLNRDIIIEKKRIPWLRYFFTVAIPTFLLAKPAYSQGKMVAVDTVKQVVGDTTINTVLLDGIVARDVKIMIPELQTVTVIDSLTSLPVPYATIQLKNRKQEFATDSTGKVSFMRPTSGQMTLIVSSVGYETVEKNFTLGKGDIMVMLTQQTINLDSVVVNTVDTSELIIVGAFGGFYIEEVEENTFLDTMKNWLLPSTAKPVVYPNPAARGTSITIDWRAIKDGDLRVTVFSSNGNAVLNHDFKLAKGTNKLQLPTGASWSAGIYYLRFFQKEKQVAVERVVIH